MDNKNNKVIGGKGKRREEGGNWSIASLRYKIMQQGKQKFT